MAVSGRQIPAQSRANWKKPCCKLGWQERTVYLAGRTDTGTHASGQVAAFDLDWGHGPDRLQDALNAYLPHDMAVSGVKTVSDTFHPRFDASSRRYRYRLFCADTRNPLRERYAWRVWPVVNDLKPLADIWLGTHDFSAFGSPTRTGGSTIRSVHFAEWQFRDNEWIFEIQADAFLYRMVRRLVFVQVAIGQGRIQAELAIQALADKASVR